MPLLKVKPLDTVVNKWGTNLPAAISWIEAGVKGAGATWEANTVAAKDTYRDAIADPKVPDRYVGGVKRVGGPKWETRMLALGIGRISDGVAHALPYYREAMSPYLDALSKIDKPPKKRRNHPDNYKIINVIGNTLNALRMKLRGG